MCRRRAVNFEIHLCSSGMNSDCIWGWISIQYIQIEHSVNSDLGNGSFWVEIHDAKHEDLHIDWRGSEDLYWFDHSTDLGPLTSDLKRCLLFWKCLRWSCLKAVSVPTSVTGGLRGSTATSTLVPTSWRKHFTGFSPTDQFRIEL